MQDPEAQLMTSIMTQAVCKDARRLAEPWREAAQGEKTKGSSNISWKKVFQHRAVHVLLTVVPVYLATTSVIFCQISCSDGNAKVTDVGCVSII